MEETIAARVRRGELVAPDDDDLATRYEQADDTDRRRIQVVQVSNWSRPGHECRHNLVLARRRLVVSTRCTTWGRPVVERQAPAPTVRLAGAGCRPATRC